MWTCEVSQGHYGHLAGKRTWLIASRILREDLPELRWGPCEQRIHPRALELHGYEKARRIGMMAMVGGKDKTRIRNATPPEFRDVLIDLARLCRRSMDETLPPLPAPSYTTLRGNDAWSAAAIEHGIFTTG